MCFRSIICLCLTWLECLGREQNRIDDLLKALEGFTLGIRMAVSYLNLKVSRTHYIKLERVSNECHKTKSEVVM